MSKATKELQRQIDELSTFRERWIDLVWRLEDDAKTAEEFYENVKGEGLTFNSIESEGAVRAMRRILNTIKLVEENNPLKLN